MKTSFVFAVLALLAGCEKKSESSFEPYTGRRDPVRIAGKVVGVHPRGIAVKCREGFLPPWGVATIGGNWGGGKSVEESDRPPQVAGTFLLVKHPQQKEIAEGEEVDVDAVQFAVYRFRDTDGADRAWKAFEVVPYGAK